MREGDRGGDRRLSLKQRTTMIRVPTHREPTHTGEMLLEEVLNPMDLSQRDLADGRIDRSFEAPL